MGTYTYTCNPDQYAENPREFCDHLGTMMMWTRRHGAFGDRAEAIRYSPSDYAGWEEFQAALEKDFDGVLLPIYMYSHGGETIRTAPFSCPWDSGQVGFIGVSKEKIRKDYSVKRISKKTASRARECLEAEVKEYACWMEGEVWDVQVLAPDGNIVESIGGIYGTAARKEAEQWAKALTDQLNAQHGLDTE